jgi:hypothetical protein
VEEHRAKLEAAGTLSDLDFRLRSSQFLNTLATEGVVWAAIFLAVHRQSLDPHLLLRTADALCSCSSRFFNC